MSAIIIGLMTLMLILVSGFLVMIILMQRASSNSGMGSALGGGAAESALGAGAGNVLTKSTILGSAAFFVLSFGLYLFLLAGADERGPTNQLPLDEELAPAEQPVDGTAPSPLINLPEGMESSAIRQELERQGAVTSTVNSDQGSMIITEDSIKVEPAKAEDAVKVDSAEATTDDSPTEAAPAETPEPASAESPETTEPVETNAQ